MSSNADRTASTSAETPREQSQSLRLRGDLRASILDGAAFGGMVGFGETYFPAFALAVGLGEMAAGMVSSVPLVAGGLMQLASPLAVKLLRSHRRWVVICAVIQALSFVPLLIAALAGSIGTTTLLLVAAVYWGAGLATGPAWNTWIGTLVPPSIRPRFFANRTRISQAGVFAGFLIGGILLQYASTNGRSLHAFAILFGVAGVCRVVSAWMLQRHSEPVPLPANMRQIPWKRVRHHLHASSGGRLLVYLVAVQAAAQMAGPFFTPFMLMKLNFSYGDLVGLFSVAFFSKVISLPAWGRVAKKIGARQLLWIGGIGIVPLSGGWLVSQNFAWLMFLQVLGGIAWAAYELAFFLLFFESIAEEERTSVLTIYNLLNTAAWVAGSLVGGLVLSCLDMSFRGYLIVFGSSSLGRLFALLLLARIPRIVVDSGEVGVRTAAVRPGGSSLDTPVLPSLPDQIRDGH
ncbi:MAG: MFS transporter [Planctomycetota bacterium]|nr:MFS transporter [Planctomycetota bacterium]MDA1248783.1 MFS transporter [Planctomycetota bacterium]